jgi:hypothetical protein
MAVRQECTKRHRLMGRERTRAIFLRKIKPTIDHEGEIA